jgi:hypothetical protein
MLAVSVILWALALAVASVITPPNMNALRGGAIALWICAMATTLIGAAVGGWLAGYLPGSARRSIGVAHGFLAWCAALVLAFGLQLVVFRSVANAAMDAAMANAASGLDTTGPATVQPGQPRAEAAADARTARDYLAVASWSWFGTWFLAGLLAMAGAAAGTRKLARREIEDAAPPRDQERPMGPLTPAPSA